MNWILAGSVAIHNLQDSKPAFRKAEGMPMQLSLTDLRLFVAVAELGSLTSAAQRCHLPLPAVSQRMLAIEEQTRCQLLVRGARGVRLTAAGEAFARHARTMLIEADSMRASLGAFAGVFRVM